MKTFKLLGILVFLLALTGCGNTKYVGYWCRYEEVGTIVVTLNEKNTKAQRDNIVKIVEKFAGLQSYDFIPKEDFIGTSDEKLAFDTYFIYFEDTKNIDEQVMTLQKLAGIQKVEKKQVKSNVSLYEFVDKKNYKFQDGLEVKDDLKVKGTYKIDDLTITLTSVANQTTLYIKNNYLCGDTACNTIYTRTDSKCDQIK